MQINNNGNEMQLGAYMNKWDSWGTSRQFKLVIVTTIKGQTAVVK